MGAWAFFAGLMVSNTFMTFAWYAHLKDMNGKPWFLAALVSWGIAFFEYLIQVPANRIGHQHFTLEQLKITQEVIALLVFIPFAVFYMKARVTWNYAAAGVCLLLAAWFVFREGAGPAG
ncbi:DMT family protein [Hahella sp. SMD15-11]|uniref:DMT family protein n=1 Tax=Thermohahella caldifontis TaxID=3142973 RepID=A0AB39US82_9GAMM